MPDWLQKPEPTAPVHVFEYVIVTGLEVTKTPQSIGDTEPLSYVQLAPPAVFSEQNAPTANTVFVPAPVLEIDPCIPYGP